MGKNRNNFTSPILTENYDFYKEHKINSVTSALGTFNLVEHDDITEFVTDNGNVVPYGDFTMVGLMKFINKLEHWQDGGDGKSLIEQFTQQELDYIYKYMEHSSLHNLPHLQRVEFQSDTFDKNNLQLGKTFKFDKGLKSFSRTEEGLQNLGYNELSDGEGPYIIFRTNGDISHFNMTRYLENNESYFNQEDESFVDTRGEFVVENISQGSIQTSADHPVDAMIVDIRQI